MIYTHKWTLDIKQRITNLQSINPENIGSKKKKPKRDKHSSPQEGKVDKILIDWQCVVVVGGLKRGQGVQRREHEGLGRLSWINHR